MCSLFKLKLAVRMESIKSFLKLALSKRKHFRRNFTYKIYFDKDLCRANARSTWDPRVRKSPRLYMSFVVCQLRDMGMANRSSFCLAVSNTMAH